jgi:DNA-binding NtrC family response regulator
VDNALRERRLWDEIRELREALGEGKSAVVAESPAMKEVLGLILRASGADTPVLLLGESGTGKEILARLLHAEGRRGEGPFMAVNCSAIPEPLLESQLFGHRRGSFTDAKEDRRGLFQEAEGGTLFLDEIGDMPVSLQAKILRVLQEKEIHPLGASAPLKVNARVVAATHRDLASLMESGRFRQDLYYRLNVIAVQVPPLRERPDDILPLAAHFLGKHGRRLGRSSCTLSPEVVQSLRRYAWPGNVRELENAIERALVLARDDVIWLHDLPESLAAPKPAKQTVEGTRPLAEVEREHILKTLGAVHWNKTVAARLLGMDRKTLHRKLDAYGIRAP